MEIKRQLPAPSGIPSQFILLMVLNFLMTSNVRIRGTGLLFTTTKWFVGKICHFTNFKKNYMDINVLIIFITSEDWMQDFRGLDARFYCPGFRKKHVESVSIPVHAGECSSPALTQKGLNGKRKGMNINKCIQPSVYLIDVPGSQYGISATRISKVSSDLTKEEH